MSARHARARWIVVVAMREGTSNPWAHGPYLSRERAVRQAHVLMAHDVEQQLVVRVAGLAGGPIRLSDYPR